MKQYFIGSHIDFQVSDRELLSEDEVLAKLLASGGAHKPKYYDFGGGQAGGTGWEGHAKGHMEKVRKYSHPAFMNT